MLLVAAGLLVYHPRTFLQLPSSNSSRPNGRLFLDDEDQVRNTLRDTVNSRPRTHDYERRNGYPRRETNLRGVKKRHSRLDSDLQALDSRIKLVEKTHLSYLT